MRNAVNIKKIMLLALALMLTQGTAFAAVWAPGQNLTSVDSVENEDLVIQGDVTIGNVATDDWVSIKATVTAPDIPHYVNVQLDQDLSISGAAGRAARFYLQADQNCWIRFIINHDLTIQGATTGQDLLVVVRGRGTVTFELDGAKTVDFAKNGANGGSAKVYVIMESQCCDQLPTLLFRRPICTPVDGHCTINVDEGSVLGYLSDEDISGMIPTPNLHDVGIIRFDPSNPVPGTGRMILNIEDQGGVVVSGRFVTLPVNPDDLTLGSIDPTQPAGCEAVFSVINSCGSPAHSGLLVTNRNNTLYDFLVDPWTNLEARKDLVNYKGTFSGVQYGMVIGTNGMLSVCEDAYFDYVGLSLDVCPEPVIPCDDRIYNLCCGPDLNCCCETTTASLCDIPVDKLVKKRNPSALVVDGYLAEEATPAIFRMSERSAVFFRSGVDNDGNIREITDENPFTIDPTKQTPCVGNLVFDVEGELNVLGIDDGPNKIELLSLEVGYTGGPVLINGTEVIFPLRTFTQDPNSDYYQYNKGYFLFNNCVQFCDAWLVHTDVLHMVYEKDDVRSEPAYIGGETFKLVEDFPHPTVAFSNSTLMVHSDIASTGFDWLIPNALDCVEPTCIENCEPDDTCIEVCEAMILPVYPTAIACLRENALPRQYRAAAPYRSKALCDGGCPFVPATSCQNNQSYFMFFFNGYVVDSGTGRQMVLGTYIGSTACDCCSIISKDSHLDIMQHTDVICSPLDVPIHSLTLLTEPNNSTIVEQISGSITDQYSIQTIYLGQASNISIGTHVSTLGCDLVTFPVLYIAGNFFSFETRGGLQNSPETSNITGQGGIFVDQNGTISINSMYRANISTMVTKSNGNPAIGTVDGVINLPRTNIFFDLRVGAAQWKLDLSDANQRVIVPAGNTISDYTLNWINTTKDYLEFIPYINGVYGTCTSVTDNNVASLPTVLGTIEQLQIKESRLGDPAHIMIDGGWVRELVFLSGYNSAEAPVGVVVLQNGGRVGLGSAHTNADSLEASIKLGVNGVTIIANGDGRVTMNSDIVIDNICHIMKGPLFLGNTLTFDAECCRELRVKGTGTLDLSSFDSGDVIDFTENVRIVLEPGAQIILDGATLRLSEDATINCEPVEASRVPTGTTIDAYDDIRAKLIGTGTIQMTGCSKFVINENAFVGVETQGETITTTSLTLAINDSASFLIGDGCSPYGGAFQIGDTIEMDGNTISFTLVINGENALFEINSRGFFGTGVGIVDKQSGVAPNSWSVGALYNVTNVYFNVQDGVFAHTRTYSGDNTEASLFMVGPSLLSGDETAYTFDFAPIDTVNVSESVIRGGGNFALLSGVGPLNPTVLSVDGVISADLSVGLLASTPFFISDSFGSGTAAELFAFWKIFDYAGSVSQLNGRATVGQGIRNQVRLGYVDTGMIGRVAWVPIIGDGGTTTKQQRSLEIGCVSISLATTGVAPHTPVAVLALG